MTNIQGTLTTSPTLPDAPAPIRGRSRFTRLIQDAAGSAAQKTAEAAQATQDYLDRDAAEHAALAEAKTEQVVGQALHTTQRAATTTVSSLAGLLKGTAKSLKHAVPVEVSSRIPTRVPNTGTDTFGPFQPAGEMTEVNDGTMHLETDLGLVVVALEDTVNRSYRIDGERQAVVSTYLYDETDAGAKLYAEVVVVRKGDARGQVYARFAK